MTCSVNIYSNTMPKTKTSRSWLKCHYCNDPFPAGRSYSNHVSWCPSQHLSTRKKAPPISLHPSTTTITHASAVARRRSSSFSSSNSSNNPPLPDDHEDQTSTSLSESEDSTSSINPISIHAQAKLRNNFTAYFHTQDDNTNLDGTLCIETAASEMETAVTDLEAKAPLLPSLFPIQQCHTLNDAVHLRLLNLCQEIGAPM